MIALAVALGVCVAIPNGDALLLSHHAPQTLGCASSKAEALAWNERQRSRDQINQLSIIHYPLSIDKLFLTTNPIFS